MTNNNDQTNQNQPPEGDSVVMVDAEAARKLCTYIGFSTKAGKTVFGTDQVLAQKHVHLVLMDASLSENAAKKIKQKWEGVADVFITDVTLESLTKRAGCKVVAIKQKSLASAIQRTLANNKIRTRGGE